MKRRDFINGMIRGGLLGALAVVSGILVSRRQVTLQGGSCDGDYRCIACSKLSGCGLPEAKTTRDHEGKG